ncbi:MAG: DUF2017 family protein [Microbacteriaceae bacterium]|nr:DUF2017 family protein [Microbacteriaceae bacterium]
MQLTGYERYFRAQFEAEEASLMVNLTTQLAMLLQSNYDEPADPDPLLASLEIGGSDAPSSDPAIARLLPDAYADPELAAKYRLVSERALANRISADAETIAHLFQEKQLDDSALAEQLENFSSLEKALGASGAGRGEGAKMPKITLKITEADAPMWLRTITHLRLTLAERSGFNDPSEYDALRQNPESAPMMAVFEWLSGLSEGFTQMLLGRLPNEEDVEAAEAAEE